MKKIKVAHIIGKWVGGGVESVVINYYRHIDKTKFEFDFICDEDSTFIPYEEIEKMGGKVILVPPYQKTFKYIKALKKIFLEEKYDIVHSHLNTLSLFPLYAAKRAKIAVRIAHSHSTTNKNEVKKNFIKMILKPFSKIYATDYFCCTEHAGRWQFGNKIFDEGKVYVLNNAIDLEKFGFNPIIRKNIRNQLNLVDDTLVIGHVGRFVAQKNQSYLIDLFYEASKINSNMVLILIGTGPDELKIREKVKNLNLSNKVYFLGQKKDIYNYYQAMDVFVFPSLYEGLGMVLIEAQASGLQCIASSYVPECAKVTSCLEFVDLNDNKKFINLMLKKYPLREDKIEEIRKSGFDINVESLKLEKNM